MDSRNKTWRLIQKWRDEYNSTPNGWAVAKLIGADYLEKRRMRQREKLNA